jgi:tetratricopeptide (TPR) repeat protein
MDFYGGDRGAGGNRLFESALHSMDAGRFAEALLCLSNLTEKDPLRGGSAETGPEMPAVYFNLALCYLKAGDYQAAVTALEKSLGLEAFPKLKFWESNLKFRGKSGLLTAFSKSLSQNRALLAHS